MKAGEDREIHEERNNPREAEANHPKGEKRMPREKGRATKGTHERRKNVEKPQSCSSSSYRLQSRLLYKDHGPSWRGERTERKTNNSCVGEINLGGAKTSISHPQ